MWKSVQPVAPVLLAIICLEGALGVLSPLIGLQLSQRGTPTLVIGFVASAYFVGFLLGTLSCHKIINRVGHIRALCVFAVCAANATLVHIMVTDAYVWVALRAVSGFSLAGAFVVIESWLNDKASEDNRSRVFAVYVAVSWAAGGVSPLLLNITDPTGLILFCLATMMMASSVIPMAMTRVSNPEVSENPHFGILKLFRISPLGAVCAFGAGVLNGSLYGLLPAFVDGVGMSQQQLSYLISVATLAALAVQFPIGHIADEYGRRPVIIGTMALSSALALMIYALPELPYLWLLCLFFLLTAFESPIYALGVGQTNDYVDKQDFVAASSGLLFAWGLGASAGPSSAGIVMEAFGPRGLFLYFGIGCALISVFAIYRVLRRRAKTAKEQSNFVAVPISQGTYGAPELDPRSTFHHHPPSPAVKDGLAS